MKIVVRTNEILKEELLLQGLQPGVKVEWINDIAQLHSHRDADAYINLLFSNGPAEIELLKSITTGTIIVSHVAGTLDELPSNFIRINGWTGFLRREYVEASCQNETGKSAAEAVFAAFSKKAEWMADLPGFVTARVIAMIINEAYFALGEEVSTKEEIDIAMKLGTNYPHGPFEWSKKIGLKNIYMLLEVMAKTNDRYKPSDLLKKEATA